MPRALFEKTGNAIWISHLDLMCLFQRAFKRAGLPLSVGVESQYELLDFELDFSKYRRVELYDTNENIFR